MTNKQKIGSQLSLYMAALIWGTSFFVVKNATDVFTPNIILAFRFTIAFLVLGVIFHKRLRGITKKDLINGGIIGACLFTAYSAQTIGITDTTPGKNAFLTAIYCVLVPFLFWLVDKKRPTFYQFFAAILCLAGIGLVSLKQGLSIGFGDSMTLVGGFFYAAHMVAIAKLARNKDPIVVTILQFAMAAVLSWIVGIGFEGIPKSFETKAVLEVLFLAFFPTSIAILLQNVGQKYTHPSTAAIILSLESVFGVIASMIFYGEKVTPKLCMGFACIFAAVIIAETNLSFLKKNKIH